MCVHECSRRAVLERIPDMVSRGSASGRAVQVGTTFDEQTRIELSLLSTDYLVRVMQGFPFSEWSNNSHSAPLLPNHFHFRTI